MENTLQKIPFLRITTALVLGIYLGNVIFISNIILLILLVAIFICLRIINRNYNFKWNNLFGFGIMLFMILLGLFVYQQQNKKPVLYENGTFVATVSEVPQEKANSYKSLLKINAVIQNDSVIPANESLISYFAKNENVANLNAGEIILFRQNPQPLRNNGNPYEFDYRKYLERKKIYRQVYLSADSWKRTSIYQNSVEVLAEQAREKLLQIYRGQPIDSTELEILSALTLGYKRDLDPETKRVFSSAGAMHVLAVSGLHVGIIFWLVSLLFGFLRKIKNGRYLFVTVVLIILWAYAFITGLSPSVTRASLMFSIYLIGDNLNRKANVYNSLAASAFIILLVNPNNLFEIGFQLSYSAVFGIVFLQPKISQLAKPNNRIIYFFWTLFTVSLAAQIATSPFSLYYFGQFPIYFWLANTLIIPSVMILIPLGMGLLLVSQISALAGIFAFVLNYTIKFIYGFLSLIENFPFAVLHTSVNALQFMLLILAMLSIFVFLINKRKFYVSFSLSMLILVFTVNLLNSINQRTKNELIVYNSVKNPCLQLIHGFNNYIISENKINSDEYLIREIQTTTKKLKLNEPEFFTFTDAVNNEHILLNNGIIYFEGKTILFQKKYGLRIENHTPDFCVNPVFMEKNATENLKSSTIITSIRFKPKLYSENYSFHNTDIEGAFRKNW